MLDLIDDTFKLTVDRFCLNEQITPDIASQHTEYECIWSAEKDINKRSNLGLAVADHDVIQKAKK